LVYKELLALGKLEFMKKLLLFIVTLSVVEVLFPNPCKAQTNVYHPFPDSNAVWNIYTGEYCGFGFDVWDKSYSYIFSGDTLIGGNNYHNIAVPAIQMNTIAFQCTTSGAWIEPGYYAGAIRQDIPGKKVFIVPPSEVVEQLLYDFNLEVGDTVKGFTESFAFPQDTVISIDSVIVGNDYRKRWFINSTYGIYLIEGIGSSYGLLELSPGMATDFFLNGICFSQNGTALYPEGSSVCDIITGIKDTTTTLSMTFNIYPNPASNYITINVEYRMKNTECRIMNVTGQEVFQSSINNQQSSIDISSLSPGIYFLTLSNGEQTVSKKFVKK